MNKVFVTRALFAWGALLSAGTAHALTVTTAGSTCTRQNGISYPITTNITCDTADTNNAQCVVHFETRTVFPLTDPHAYAVAPNPVNINRGATINMSIYIVKTSDPTDPQRHHEIVRARVEPCSNPNPALCSTTFGVYELRRDVIDPPCPADGRSALDSANQEPIISYTGNAMYARSTNADAKFYYLGHSESAWGAGVSTISGNFGPAVRKDLLRYDPSTGAASFYEVVEDPFNREMFGSLTLRSSMTWGTGFQVFAADVDGDGRDEVFRYNPTTGRAIVSIVSNAYVATDVYDNANFGTGWQLHFANLNTDSRIEIVRYNSGNGQFIFTAMINPTPGTLTHVDRSIWSLWSGHEIHFANLNAAPDKEVIDYDPVSGFMTMMEFTEDLQLQGAFAFDQIGPGLQVHTGNIDNDAHDELLFFNAAAGTLVVKEGTLHTLMESFSGGGWGINYQFKIGNITGQAPERIVRYNGTTGHFLVTRLFTDTDTLNNSINITDGAGFTISTRNRSYYRSY